MRHSPWAQILKMGHFLPLRGTNITINLQSQIICSSDSFCGYVIVLLFNWQLPYSPFVGRMQVLLMPNGKNWFYSLHGIQREDLRLNSSFHLFLVTCFAKVCLLRHNRSDYWKPGRETIFYLWRQLRTWSCQDNKNVYHNNRTKASGKTALSSVSLFPCSSIS